MTPSFTHIINPFVCSPESEHGIASGVTYASLARACEVAQNEGVRVEINAVVMPGDEGAVHAPACACGHLTRSVQDIHPLKPRRPLPLIDDILRVGAASATGTHLIFTNMDIAVQPNFYPRLAELITQRFDSETPFIVYRRNIPARYSDPTRLEEMYAAPGDRATGYDCFVFPRALIDQLDLGHSCIGASYVDYLLFMALDAASGFRMQRVSDVPLTFHIGNDLAWSTQFDYIEHNLVEAKKAIARMRTRYSVPEDSHFARFERDQFRPLTRIDSRIKRTLKRLPWVGTLAGWARGTPW